MDDLKAKLIQAGLTGSVNKEYVLSAATKRLFYNDEVIWGNLINGEWLRIPKITDQFLANCLLKPSRECIDEFAAQTGLPVAVFEKLLTYVAAKGFITKNTPQGVPIEGVEFISTSPAPEQKMEVEEAFYFQKILINLAPRAGNQEKALSLREWELIFNKLSAAQCRESDIFFHKTEDENIASIITLAKSYFSKINYHYILYPESNDLPLIQEVAGLLSANDSHITFHLEPLPSDNPSLAERLKEVTTPFTDKDIPVQINLSFWAAPGLAQEVYIITKNLSLPFSFEICSLAPNEKSALTHEELLHDWFCLLSRDSASDSPFSKFSGGESFFGVLKLSCGAGKFAITISNAGNIYPCPGLMVDELKIGSLLGSDLPELERNAKKLLGKTDVAKKKGCENCAIGYFCGGGCLARGYAVTGKVDGADPLCEFFKKGPGLVPWRFDLEKPLPDNIKQMFSQRVWGDGR